MGNRCNVMSITMPCDSDGHRSQEDLARQPCRERKVPFHPPILLTQFHGASVALLCALDELGSLRAVPRKRQNPVGWRKKELRRQ